MAILQVSTFYTDFKDLWIVPYDVTYDLSQVKIQKHGIVIHESVQS